MIVAATATLAPSKATGARRMMPRTARTTETGNNKNAVPTEGAAWRSGLAARLASSLPVVAEARSTMNRVSAIAVPATGAITLTATASTTDAMTSGLHGEVGATLRETPARSVGRGRPG